MKVLLAVSGGIDSMYMLHKAPELFPGALYAVAHCNFGLRGEDSDADEAFVCRECAKLGVECFVKRFDTISYASSHGVSIEMAARDLRYGWFRTLCEDGGFDLLATAHNANDNAETLILNLLRGTGTRGLRGIPAAAALPGLPHESSHSVLIPPGLTSGPLPFTWPRAATASCGSPGSAAAPSGIVRPLLGISREEIRSWMEAKGHAWREDRTNAENGPKRNKIRNQVFPVFAEINPSFIRTLSADIERFAQTDDIAEDYYRAAEASIVGKTKYGETQISVTGLLALKHWRYVLWRFLEDASFSAETFNKLCTLLERFRTEPLGTVTLSGKKFESPCCLLKARKKTLVLSSR